MIWEISEQTETIEGLDASGRPDPAYAAALGLLPAPLGRRALAAISDVIAWIVVQLPLWLGAVPLLLKLATGSISAYGLVNHPGFVLAVVMASITVLLSLALAIVQWAMHGVKGMTIGKAIWGIRTVDVRTLERPGMLRLLLRWLIIGAAGLIPAVGSALFLASPLFDPDRRRGWHDKATGVWLIDVRAGLNPFDEKRLRVARKMVKADPLPERAPLPSLATPDNPSAQPSYRPGSRVSAGVLGVARPHDGDARPVVGLPPAEERTPEQPVEPGKPRLGGYRQGPTPDAAEPAPASDGASAAPAPTPQEPATPPRERRTVAVQREQPVAAKPVQYGLRFDTGEGVAITAAVLLGRGPDAAGHPDAVPIALADDTRSLSKTHLLARPVDDGIELTDCHSTNGSGLIRDGVEYALVADVPATAAEGDVVRMGDRIATVVRV